jgi:hypothetical protein
MMRDYRVRDHELELLAALAEARRLAEESARAHPDAEAFFEVNDWLQERFPENPVGLYHRARILEDSWAKAPARQRASR